MENYAATGDVLERRFETLENLGKLARESWKTREKMFSAFPEFLSISRNENLSIDMG